MTSVKLHGHDLHYVEAGPRAVEAGDGEPILLVHGMLGSHETWTGVIGELSDRYRVIAPDLFGHGSSAKPIGDYSLSSHAATLRDLLDRLGIDRVTLVGHSLGGGIVMQFSYLFPERVARLVLVSSGGLGREVSLLLRAATLPGADLVLTVAASKWVRDRVGWIGNRLHGLGIKPGADTAESWRAFVSLGDRDSRRAFLATTRSVLDRGGQTVTALDHLPLAEPLPVLLVWGAKDPIIPSWHAVIGQQGFPGCRVELFEHAGHFPHLDQPERFATALTTFMAEPAVALTSQRAPA